ncbi:hypothetical protein F5Y18DRAFT_203615 [Xylariaceae sp. FL1019]|nr:hypothetical protein F5Y18DRAFT_203615 [Xylariaceae sp. FL1019]
MSTLDSFPSSPPRPSAYESRQISSSSPYLPSIEDIIVKNKKPALRPGSNAVSIPANARATFTTAADILREAPEIDIDTEKITHSPPRRAKATKPRKRNAPAATHILNDQDPNRPIANPESPSKDKPWQKFKSPSPVRRKTTEEPILPKEEKKPTARKPAKKKAESVSKHFSTKGSTADAGGNGTEEVTEVSPSAIHDPMEAPKLEAAMARRGDWTPPRIQAAIVLDSDPDARELFSSVDRPVVSKDVFQNLLDDYGRQNADAQPPARSQPEILRKRKQIELISTGKEGATSKSGSESPTKEPQEKPGKKKKQSEPKAPAPKKKARTITELATAPFMPVEPEVEIAGPSTKESMLSYFDTDGAVSALVEHQTALMSQRNPRGKDPKEPPKTKRKKKTGTVANPILLSPNSALKQSSNQDFVFGTSSQLMQEDSPTMLRDLQAAIRASNAIDSDPFEENVRQRLWNAGARDEEGELMDIEMVDLRHAASANSASDTILLAEGQTFVDINDLLDSPIATKSAPKEATQASKSHFFQSQATSNATTSSNTPKSQTSTTTATTTTTTAAPSTPRPNFDLFTDAQLAKQIASYGFKAVKKRPTMIALLNQCWISQHSEAAAAQTQPLPRKSRSPSPAQKKASTAPAAKAAAKTAKPRARGRPKKDDMTADTAVKTPAPSAVSETPSPSRARGRPKKSQTAPASAQAATTAPSPKRRPGRPRKISTVSTEIADSEGESDLLISGDESPPPMDASAVDEADEADEADMSLALSPTDQQAELFRHITKAVTSAPRSTDPAHPSWHEKMLLYDPVVLEDLASWLNGGELTRVGQDGEVSASDVKKWCESKSVNCMWRQNLHGKERKRY